MIIFKNLQIDGNFSQINERNRRIEQIINKMDKQKEGK